MSPDAAPLIAHVHRMRFDTGNKKGRISSLSELTQNLRDFGTDKVIKGAE